MRLIWWVALGVGAYYLLKKKPEETMVSYSDAQKLGLVKAVSDAVSSSGITRVWMVVNEDKSITFFGWKYPADMPQALPSGAPLPPKSSVPQKITIGTFASPDAVNEWVKSQPK